MLVIAGNIQKSHNFEAGQCILGFGQHDGKMYYRIQKDVSKNYSGTSPKLTFVQI